MVGNRLSHTFYLTNICTVRTLLEAQHIFSNFDNTCCEPAQNITRYCLKLSQAHSLNLKAGRCGREWGKPFVSVMCHWQSVWAPLTGPRFPVSIFCGFIYTLEVQTCLCRPNNIQILLLNIPQPCREVKEAGEFWVSENIQDRDKSTKIPPSSVKRTLYV